MWSCAVKFKSWVPWWRWYSICPVIRTRSSQKGDWYHIPQCTCA